MKFEELCTEYLSNINPLARRVAEDIGSLNLNNDTPYAKERLVCIDKCLIQPRLVDKYKSDAEEITQLLPESNFSWFSKSQLNLFTAIDVKPIIHTKLTPNRAIQVLSPLRKAKEEKNSAQTTAKGEDKPVKQAAKKPKTPPPPPPAKLVAVTQPTVPKGAQTLSQSDDEDIPKTGFDFLDNW